MFDRLKKKLEPKENKITKATKENKEVKETAEAKEPKEPEVAVKSSAEKKSSKKGKKTTKPEKTAEDVEPQAPQAREDAGLKVAEKEFVGIKEYSSALEISEKLDEEIAKAKSALGGYLRQLDDVRGVAERSKRLYDIVGKMAGKKQSMEKLDAVEVNGLEIVLDATALNELSAIESVVKSYQQRLMDLKKAQESLKTLDQVGDTKGIRYLVLEREGIPEQILLKLS